MISDGVLLALFCACIAAGGFVAVGSKLLFRWYLREVRRLEIPQDRGEAIATYPFA
jgi:hypothetical protein